MSRKRHKGVIATLARAKYLRLREQALQRREETLWQKFEGLVAAAETAVVATVPALAPVEAPVPAVVPDTVPSTVEQKDEDVKAPATQPEQAAPPAEQGGPAPGAKEPPREAVHAEGKSADAPTRPAPEPTPAPAPTTTHGVWGQPRRARGDGVRFGRGPGR